MLEPLLLSFIYLIRLPTVTTNPVSFIETTFLVQGQPVANTEGTEKLVLESVSLMRRGKRLENAITNLSEAVRREPKNAQYALLLASAQAERAYVLAEMIGAIQLADARRKRREQALAAWESAQKEKNNPLYGTPKPEFQLDRYDDPRTPDDDKPIALTEEQARQRVRELSGSSLALLEKAEQLSTNLPKTQNAETLSLCGWTALVLWHGPRRVVPESWPKKTETTSTEREGPERVFSYLEKAVALAPENSKYELEFADARLIAAVDQPNPSRPPIRFDKELFESGKAALAKAAKRRPNDGALWFFMASLEGVGVGNEGKGMGLLPRTPENIAALRKATVTFPDNALVWYTLASAQSSLKDDTGALDSVARGNNVPSLKPVSYRTSAPTLMRWVFNEMPIQYPMQTVLLGLSLTRMGDEGKRKGDDAAVMRAAQMALQISKKYEAALNNLDLSDSQKSVFLVNAFFFKDFASSFPKLPPSQQ